jgi:DNA-binding NarL/FixJ family response regulator
MPKLLIVEDNAILASTLLRFLREQDGLTVAAVAPTAEAALEQLSTLKVDLVLVDVALPAMNGIDLVEALHKQYPALPCLMLSGHNGIDYVGRALAAGAKGYVVKSSPQSILEAVERVLAGEIYLSEELQRKS